VARKISLRDFNGLESNWKNGEEAKSIFEQIHSHEVQKMICTQRSEEPVERKRSIRSTFMKLFTTSKMGLAIKDTGAGKRNRKDQINFRTEIINSYASRHEKQDWLWCPILGEWLHSKHTTAAHLFAYMHGQDTMDAIFGKTKTPELFSARNGLLVSSLVEDIFDLGKLVLIPDLPDKPSAIDMGVWMMKRPRDYKFGSSIRHGIC
jgi:HNH endonuclease